MINLNREELEEIMVQCLSESDFRGASVDFREVEFGRITELEDHLDIQVFGTIEYDDTSTKPIEAMIALYEDGTADVLTIKEVH